MFRPEVAAMNDDPRELCFVLMPFGHKPDQSGRVIDFDAVYEQLIRPAIEDAGLRPLRSDEETRGGIVHKQMFERLLLCPFAVADLSTANANVYYEVGVRHATRPRTTILVFSHDTDLKFDVSLVRSVRYDLDAQARLGQLARDRAALTHRLREARQVERDSPIFELFRDYQAPSLPHSATDTFREVAHYSEQAKEQLAGMRARHLAGDVLRRRDAEAGKAAMAAARAEVEAWVAALGDANRVEAGVLVDALLTLRAVELHAAMVEFVARMPEHVRRQRLIQEQLGFALNRCKRSEEAEQVLRKVIHAYGPSPETCGLMGRIHKDRWVAAVASGDAHADAQLHKAIESYLRGFQADWRDSYPGVNAVTLMQIAGDERWRELLPVVRYAVMRRLDSLPDEREDYWDHATMLEISVLASDPKAAHKWLGSALARRRETWESKTTADNLALVRRDRERLRAAGAPPADAMTPEAIADLEARLRA